MPNLTDYYTDIRFAPDRAYVKVRFEVAGPKEDVLRLVNHVHHSRRRTVHVSDSTGKREEPLIDSLKHHLLSAYDVNYSEALEAAHILLGDDYFNEHIDRAICTAKGGDPDG